MFVFLRVKWFSNNTIPSVIRIPKDIYKFCKCVVYVQGIYRPLHCMLYHPMPFIASTAKSRYAVQTTGRHPFSTRVGRDEADARREINEELKTNN